MFELSFHVFMCAFHSEIFFREEFPLLFFPPIFLCYSYFGSFLSTWSMYICTVLQVDVSADVAYVMAPKEEPELLVMKKACYVSVDVFNKYLKDQIMEIIDSDKVSY